MEFRYTKGQRLVIQLIDTQVFEGDCERCGKDRIDLINIVEYQHGNKLKDSLSYYRCEIESVKVLNEEPLDEPQLNNNNQVSPPRKIIAISHKEYDRLRKMTTEYTYFTVMDEEYSKAICYLQNRESVGVFAAGYNVEQNKISLLALSSRLKVYLFDLLILSDDLPVELRAILECHEIVKVVHEAQPLSESLWQIYQVKLNNVLDTHKADLKLQAANEMECKTVKSRNLLECLECYFNFPTIIVKQSMNMNWEKWEQRPLKQSRKIKAAQFVAYLITLKNKLKEILLKDHNDMVTTRIQTLNNRKTFEARTALNLGDVILEDVLVQIPNIPAIGY